MATRAICRPAYTKSGNSPELRYAPESYGRTFRRGSLVQLSASGRLIPVNVANHINRAFIYALARPGSFGLAAENAKGTTRSYLSATMSAYYPFASDDIVFAANVFNDTAATATIGWSALGSVGYATYMTLGAGSTIYVCSPRGVGHGGASATSVYILGFEDVPTGIAGTEQYARVYFQFSRDARNRQGG